MNLCLIVLKCNAIFTCEKFLTFLTFLHEPLFYILYYFPWTILPEAYYVRGEKIAGCYISNLFSCEFCRHFQTYCSQADKIKQLKASMSFNKSYIFCSRKIIHLNIRANTPHLLLYLWSGNLIIKCLILSY